MRGFLVLITLAVSLAEGRALRAEELYGEEMIPGSDFPRLIGGNGVTEGEYTVYFRDCAVALDILEKPVANLDELALALQVQYFIQGAAYVSAKNTSYNDFVLAVNLNCRIKADLTLADAVDTTARNLLALEGK